MSDPFDLERFVQAQDPALAQVRRELGEGRKRSHWMWFVFPQLRGLGRSAMAQRYGIGSLAEGRKRSHWMWFVFPQLRVLGRSATARHFGIGSLAEARAYLAHPLLGSRLIECTRTVLATEGRSLHAIFGSPDDMKFQSSMTLFALAAASLIRAVPSTKPSIAGAAAPWMPKR